MYHSVLGLGALWMTAFWVFLVAGIAWLVLRLQRPDDEASRDPLRILEARLARGEIDVAEFTSRRDTIEASR